MINFRFNLPVLLIVFFLLFFISGSYYNSKTYFTFKDLRFKVLDPLKVDQETTCVIGSSRVRELGNPMSFNAKQPNIINLGISGSSFMTNFFIALYILENKKPKNILFEVTPYAGIHLQILMTDFQLLDVFNATSLGYLDYIKILYEFKTNGKNSSRTDYFSYSNHFYDYIKTFDFFRYVNNTDKEIMFDRFRNYIGNNAYTQDRFESNICSEEFKSMERVDFSIDTLAGRPIEAYFIAYLNEIAAKKGIDIKYVVPLALNRSFKEYVYFPTQLYHLGIKGVHQFDTLFLKSIYRKENFLDKSHFNRKGMELFYNEVFN
jgi:hypothetical protein